MNDPELKLIADRMQNAAERMEAAAHRMAVLFEDGYGGNGLRLIDILEKQKREEEYERTRPQFGDVG